MIVHFNQPRFLPALNYFQRMLIADVFVYRDDVQFQRKDWESRNKIKTPQGWMWMTVPVKHCAPGTNIMAVEIDNTSPWSGKMLRSIEVNYGRAQHFKEWFDHLGAILDNDWRSLGSLNARLIAFFRAVWDIECKTVQASSLHCDGDTDEILIAMCKKLGATTYLSGAEGRNYNVPENWAAAGIELRYHDYVPVEYPQQHGPFIPWMSALDLLMNCGADGRKYLEPKAA